MSDNQEGPQDAANTESDAPLNIQADDANTAADEQSSPSGDLRLAEAGSATDVDTKDAALTQERQDDDFASLGQFVYYSASPQNLRPPRPDEISPDFFELTANDVRDAQSILAAKASAIQKAPLLTEALRNKRTQEKLEKWPIATIRILFPDRSMLEKSFPSADRIKSVYAFMRTCLRVDIRIHKFVLFLTPPRRDLKVSDASVKEKSLYDLRLCPRSMLHFKFIDDDVDSEFNNGPPPLLPAILEGAITLPLPVEPIISEPVATPSAEPTEAIVDPKKKVEKRLERLLKLTKRK